MYGGIWLCRIMENYVCVSEQQWGMFADCLGSFGRKEHAIRSLSLSGAWGEIVCLSGLSGWRMRAVIRSVCVRACVCSRALTVTWRTSPSAVRKWRILRCVKLSRISFWPKLGAGLWKQWHRNGFFISSVRSRESPEVSVSFITSGWCRSVPCTWLRLHKFVSSLTTETRPTTGRGPPWVHARQIWRTDLSDTTGERKVVT